MKISRRITVSGLVQGVGYRYFAYRTAMEYGVKGYAKNLITGDVEIEAEGEAGLMNDFIHDLKIGPQRSNVTSIAVDELPFENKYKDFSVY